LSNQEVKNQPASVRQKLLNLARERNDDFGLLLMKYALERILYRLSLSKHHDLFILKGAMLFELWTQQTYRPTRDLDFLARGKNDVDRLVTIVRDVCSQETVADGLTFDPKSIVGERIKEDADYAGVRIQFVSFLGNARIPIQIDMALGDVVTPDPLEIEYPTLLDMPAPKVLAYPKESVVAEKLEAMVTLGMANSRMKDFYDLHSLSEQLTFEGALLAKAVYQTFLRRKTEIPEGPPLALTEEFYRDESKNKQWDAFCNRNKLYVKARPLEQVAKDLQAFLGPVLRTLSSKKEFDTSWSLGGPWRAAHHIS